MENIWLPARIRSRTENRAYEQNRLGMSGAQVFLFDDCVLKVQQATEETENEAKICGWLRGRLPVPEILEYMVENGTAYTLMSRVRGDMLCSPAYLSDAELLTDAAAAALKMLWEVDITDCPCDSSLDVKLRQAEYNVERGLVDMDNVEPETFGEGGFSSPRELLCWLKEHRPKEEPALTHGDFCLPNIFAKKNEVAGYIDLGRAGVADRWQDIAICYRSIRHNLEGRYSGGKVNAQFEPKTFFERLGVAEDRKKLRYYILLDELF